MKTNLNYLLTVFGFIFLCFFETSCKKEDKIIINTLTVDNPYLVSYTSGIISTQSDIQIVFASTNIPGAEAGTEITSSSLIFNPKLEGKLYWKNKNTLVFEPSKPLPAAQKYKVTLDIASLIKDAKSPYDTFSFAFATREQHLGVTIEGLKIFENQDKNKINFSGTIFTEDIVSKKELTSCVEAKIDGKLVDIVWENDLSDKTHIFSISNIQRTEKQQDIKINLKGDNIGAPEKYEITYIVPATGVFTMIKVSPVNNLTEGIRIEFSELLDPNQDLEGFIEIEGYSGSLPYLIEQNTLRIFPENISTGNYALKVSKGIKSNTGNTLNKLIKENFYINPSFPAVILSGTGAIVPHTEGVLFPFNAIGLSAVDVEIFKVGSHNIVSLLKDNDINEANYNMYRVGKIIKQKTITLHHVNPLKDGMEWKEFYLDLNDLIKTDPGAIYQVRIGFRQEYAISACVDEPSTDIEKTLSDKIYFKDEEGKKMSIMDNFFGGIPYNENYTWANRENPCFPEFYNADRFISGNLLVSNYGITAKRGSDDLVWVSVSDLMTTDPVANITIDIYNEANDLISQQKTDQDGIAKINLKNENPAVVVAHSGKNKGYLRLKEEDALNLSRFDISGEQIKGDVRGFIYAERNIWKPGDSLFFNFMLHDKKATLPKEYPITMELFDAKGQLYEKRVTNKQINGIYPLSLSTQVNDQTGTWRISIKAGANTFEKSFKIESIKPNRLKSTLVFDNILLKKDKEPFKAQIKANWLTGIPAAECKAVVELKLKDEATTFNTFPSFMFGNEFFKNNSSDARTVFNGPLSTLGTGTFSLKISENPDVSGKLTALFQTRIFEPSGDFSTTIEKITYHPFSSYVGIEIPLNQWGEPVLAENKPSILRFAVADNEGNPLKNKQISVSLFKTDWYWWWDNNQYKNADFNTETAKKTAKEIMLTTDSRGIATWKLTLNEWGRYLLLAEDISSGHRSAQYIHSGYPDGASDSNEKNLLSLMPVKTEKNKYKPGEKAILSFPGSSEGTAIITIENGSSVIQTIRIKTKKGTNTLSIPVNKEMAPNVYAYVSFIQSYKTVKNDLPIRMFGICPIQVEDPTSILKPKILAKESFKPGEKISMAISEESGKAMTYTLSVVDEGLLGITRFKTPDPHASFYSKIGLGIRTWDIYNKVLGTYVTDFGNLLAVGGDESYQSEALNNTGTQFNSVVFSLGPFTLKKGEKVNHTLTLPNYMGAVRIMVVAKNEASFGSAEKLVPVKSPLMLFASAPKTLAPGDEFSLPINIFSTQNNIGKVVISAEDEAGILKNITPGISINMQGLKEKLTQISFKAGNKTGIAKIKIKISSTQGSAFQMIEIPVRNPNPITYRIKSQVLKPGEMWTEELESFGQKGTRDIILETSSLSNIGLQKRLSFLLTYPYGCLEQTVSTAFSQLYLEQWVKLTPYQNKLRQKHIQSAIQQINKFQLSSGGFSYWPGNYQFDEWVTSYTGQFLLEAKTAGFIVPANMLKKWEKFQVKLIKGLDMNEAWATAETSQMNQAYRLYTLALAGKAEKGAMNQMRETKSLYLSAANRLAGAYALAGNKDIAIKILNSKYKKQTTIGYYNSYGSDLRDKAQLLESYLLSGNKTVSANLAMQLGKDLSSNNWYSTHSTAYALLALSKYLGSQKAGEPAKFRFNSKETNGKWVDVQHNETTSFTQFQDFSGKQKVQIKNTGKSTLFFQLVQSGQEEPGKVVASKKGILLSVDFKSLNGKKLDPTQIPQGEDFNAEITVKHSGENPYHYQDLGLTQVFPSGWEIINERITDFNNQSGINYDYLDIKTDRTSYFFSLQEREVKKFTVRLNATFQGRYYFPAANVSDMYNHNITANTDGKWIYVSNSKK
jgi:uncharacterized protein YfaS (alpha-2-macroglobulin family)